MTSHENAPVNFAVNTATTQSINPVKPPVKKRVVKEKIDPFVPELRAPLTAKQAYDYWTHQSIRHIAQKDDVRTLEAYQMLEWLRKAEARLTNEKSYEYEIADLMESINLSDEQTVDSINKTSRGQADDQEGQSESQSNNQSNNQSANNWITATSDPRFYKFTRSGDVIVHVQAPPKSNNPIINQSMNNAVMCRYRVRADLFDKLHHWQKEGLHFLCSLHVRDVGGILGDDMGLGKTIQCAAFLSTLAYSGLGQTSETEEIEGVSKQTKTQRFCSLLVAPLAVLVNWQRELEKWCPELEVFNYHSATEAQRTKFMSSLNQSIDQINDDTVEETSDKPVKKPAKRATRSKSKTKPIDQSELSSDDEPLQQTVKQSVKQSIKQTIKQSVKQSKSGVVILINTESFSGAKGTQKFFDCHPENFLWDVIGVDEGHRLKNADSLMTQSIKRIPSIHRILLTGTPVQNDLSELWSLFDFACHGRLLGERKKFRDMYASTIERGLAKEASRYEQQQARTYANHLKQVISPHMIARDKATVGLVSSGVMTCSKTDLTVWLKLSPTQLELYKNMLESSELKQLLNTSRSPLVAINLLKKACQHEQLVTRGLKQSIDSLTRTIAQTSLQSNNQDLKLESIDQDDDEAFPSISDYSIDELIGGSEKLRMLLQMTKYHKSVGHRTVVFSQRARMLDLIEPVLKDSNIKYVRLDGSIRASERQVRIDAFSNDHSIDVFLLTTGVGSVGLNLVSAARVIVLDPSWNPAVDAQAVDRCYRIGQTKDVLIYRFITSGSVEEVVYRKQVYKSAVSQTVNTRKGLNEGLFTFSELRDMFKLPSMSEASATQQMLTDKYPIVPHTLPSEIQEQIQWMQTQDIWGVTDHALAAAGKEQAVEMQ